MTKTTAKMKRDNFWERNRKSNGYLLKRTVGSFIFKLFRAVLLAGMAFVILQPVLNKISISFMAEQDIYDPTIISVPEHFTAANYQLCAGFMDYFKTLGNTFLISGTIALLQVAMCTLVGYGFARFKFPFKKVWFAFVMLTVIVPPQTIATSLHLHFRYFDVLGIFELITGKTLNLRGSVIPYYLMSAGCMGLKNGLYIYMIRQFFRNVPNDVEESAYVDGCGTFKTFYKIMLRDSVPIITSCFLFAFVWQWTDGFYSRLFLGKVKLLATQLQMVGERLGNYMVYTLFVGPPSTNYVQCIIATGTLMVVVPIIIVYLFAQKGFVESLSSTGVKM